MRELSFMMARISLPNAGSSSWFSFRKGGKQGGVETPDSFNMLVEFAMEKLVISWNQRGCGAYLCLDKKTTITHLNLCDNIWLFASDYLQFCTMSQELTDSLYEVGLSWKAASLEFMVAGGAPSSTQT